MKRIISISLLLIVNKLFEIKAENSKVISRELLFDNRKIQHVIPKSEKDVKFLNNLRSSNFGIVFWNGIGNFGEPFDLLTTPSLLEELRNKYSGVHLEITELFSKVIIAMSQIDGKASVTSECENVGQQDQPIVKNGNTFAPMNLINGTDLYSGVYYRVGMRKFPQGFLTWTSKRDIGEAYFWQIDLNKEAWSMYEPGGLYQYDCQWAFGETELPGWYTFANRGVPNGFATWSNTKINSGNHLIVTSTPTDFNRLSARGVLRNNAFWMPVTANENNFYQLALKSIPEGKVTWSYTKYGNYSHYVIVATKDEDMNFYQPGNKWYDDTLFRIELGSKLLLEGTVFDFQFGGTLDEILKQNYNQISNISTVDQFNIPKRSSVSDTLEIDETIIERTKAYAFQFEEDIFDLIIKTKADFFDETGCKELKCEKGGLCTKAIDRSIKIKTNISIPRNSKCVVCVDTEWVKAFEMPFSARMTIVGKVERLLADGSGNVDFGTAPANLIERFFKSKGNEVEIIYREDASLIVEVSGKLSGIFPIKTVVTPQFT